MHQLGIVRHMAEVERNWFRPVLGGEPMATIFAPDMDFEAAFRDVAAAEVAEAFRIWRAECDHARMLVAAAPSLDVQGFRLRGWVCLRWVLTHLIEEYARHNGHADLLRERLDGSTGEWPRRRSGPGPLAAPPPIRPGSALALVLERKLELGPEGDRPALAQVDVLPDHLSHPEVMQSLACSLDRLRGRVLP